MLCRLQYEIRKPFLLRRQIKSNFVVQKSIHEDVLVELKQIGKFYNIKDVHELIQTKKIFYSHSVFLVDKLKFDSFTYSDEYYNHFKFVKKVMTDYYEEKTITTFNKNLSWKQYNPSTMELEHTYRFNRPREIKYDTEGNEIGSLILNNPPVIADLKDKIKKCGLSLKDFIPYAWGYKNYGMVVEFHPRETYFSLGRVGESLMGEAWL
tara:strand:+ start:323 stop:946 length:624 start_codon:yes stop_codon:yes gene_type:complete